MSKTIWYIIIGVLLLFAFSSFSTKKDDTDTDLDGENPYLTGTNGTTTGGTTNEIRYDRYGTTLNSTPTRTDPNAELNPVEYTNDGERESDRVNGTTTGRDASTSTSTRTTTTTTTPTIDPNKVDPYLIDFSQNSNNVIF
jgi:hypothetical protein